MVLRCTFGHEVTVLAYQVQNPHSESSSYLSLKGYIVMKRKSEEDKGFSYLIFYKVILICKHSFLNKILDS